MNRSERHETNLLPVDLLTLVIRNNISENQFLLLISQSSSHSTSGRPFEPKSMTLCLLKALFICNNTLTILTQRLSGVLDVCVTLATEIVR